jgi:hypothetical protein
MQKTSIIEIVLSELNLSTDPLCGGMACSSSHRVLENKRITRYKKNNMRRLKSTHLLLSA